MRNINVLGWFPLLVMVLASANLVAQQWQKLPIAVSALTVLSDGPNGNSSAICYNEAADVFWASSGLRAISSTDGGRSWYYVELPQGATAYKYLMFANAGDRVCAVWKDFQTNGHLATWAGGKVWSEIMLGSPGDLSIGSSGPLVIAGTDPRSSSFWTSTGADSSWKQQSSRGIRGKTDEGFIMSPRPGAVAIQGAIRWYELTSQGLDSTFSADVMHYGYGKSHLNVSAAFRRKINSSTRYSLAFSNDGGASWMHVDSIAFVNSSRIIGGMAAPKDDMNAVLVRTRGDTTIVVFASGAIATTVDNGASFYDRGVLPCRSRGVLQRTCVFENDGSLLFAECGQMMQLPSDVTKPVKMLSSNLGILEFRAGKSSIVAASNTYMLISVGGSDWLLTGAVDELLGLSTINGYGQKPMLLDFIDAIDSLHVSGVSEQDKVQVSFQQQYGAWRLNSYVANLSITPYNSDDAVYSIENFPIAKASHDKVRRLLNGYPVDIDVSADTLINLPVPMEKPFGPVRYYLEDGVEVFCQLDSLWYSPDRGKTWSNVSAGLPTDSAGKVFTVSSIVGLSNNRLLCGFRTFDWTNDANSSTKAMGGIWYSDDRGETWSPVHESTLANTNVWFMHRKGDVEYKPLTSKNHGVSDTAIATVGIVEMDSFTGALTMRDSRIVTSIDNGVTWQTTYDEGRRQPAFGGRREILSMANGCLAVATIENGVAWSLNGINWNQLGSDELSGKFISDIDADTNGVLYASTNEGVFKITPPAVTSALDFSIDIPHENGQFLTLWTYPTPTDDRLVVRINNVQIAHGDIRTLKLYDIYGVEVQNVTSQLPSMLTAGRIEFPVVLQAMPNGVYFIVLETGVGTLCTKIIVGLSM